mgnify:FL=1
MSDNSKKPTTLNDVINQGRETKVYDRLNVEERLRYLMIYVQESKKLHPHNHKEIILRTDKEFSIKH